MPEPGDRVTLEITISRSGLTPEQQNLLAQQLQNITAALLPERRHEMVICRERVAPRGE